MALLRLLLRVGYFAHFNPANNKAEGAVRTLLQNGYVSSNQ